MFRCTAVQYSDQGKRDGWVTIMEFVLSEELSAATAGSSVKLALGDDDDDVVVGIDRDVACWLEI